MRSGNFLVAQNGSLLEFNARGVVAQHRLPGSASHIELLADQCTLLYSGGNRVAQFNICTNEPLPDFVVLRNGAEAGAIRQLPNADVLVADGVAVERFTRDGKLLSMFPFIGVTHIALSVDGLSFWGAAVDGERAYLRHFELDTTATETIPLEDPPPAMTSTVPFAIDDLVVVGEWRASAAVGRRRAASSP